MKNPQRRADDGEEILRTKWFTLYRKGIVLLLALAVIVGLFTVLIFNVGYEPGKGWYWKPNNLEVKLKKEAQK